jgi:hypothetical protein
LKFRVGHGFVVSNRQLVQRRYQRLRHKPPAELAKIPPLVWEPIYYPLECNWSTHLISCFTV